MNKSVVIGGMYEIPRDSKLYANTGMNWLYVRYNEGTHVVGYCYAADEYGLDQSQETVTMAEFEAIRDFHLAKHGVPLTLQLSKSGHYQVRYEPTNGILECSHDLVAGRIKLDREIPSAKDTVHQSPKSPSSKPSELRTQTIESIKESLVSNA